MANKKEKKIKSNRRRTIEFIFALVGASLGVVILVVGIYAGVLLLSYHRIGNVPLDIDRKSDKTSVEINKEYTALTYNIGFGAYSQDYTFFMDDGYDENGNPTCGHYGTALSYEDVVFNSEGALNTVKNLNPDFVMLQEVDTNSTRSYGYNQDNLAQQLLPNYDHTFATNFHSLFLPYPLYDMHGAVNSGLTTLSRYQIQKADRKEYTVTSSLKKLFDLDRCFSVNEVSVNNGKKLYIVNSHMSAYDESGIIREKQIEELKSFIKMVEEEQNYLIIGGDFNHNLLTNNPDFNYDRVHTNPSWFVNKKDLSWTKEIFDENKECILTKDTNTKLYADDTYPTCRNNDIPWEQGVTYVVVVDGFIVSNNIEVSETKVIATNNGKLHTDWFAYSDHQPVKITFKLN